MKSRKIVGSIAYLFWLVAVVIYALSVFGFQKFDDWYVVSLSKNSTGTQMNLGYWGLCVTEPGNTDNSSCTLIGNFKFDNNKTNDELIKNLIDEMDLEPKPTGQYIDDLGTLVEMAKIIRNIGLDGYDLVAGFVLTLVGGIVMAVALFLFSKKPKVTALIWIFACLCMGFGLGTAGVAFISTDRVLKLLLKTSGPLRVSSGSLTIGKGKTLYACLLTAVVMNGIVILFMSLIAYLGAGPSQKRVPHNYPHKPPKASRFRFTKKMKPRRGRR
ncbi:hypothetical protein FALBO_10336 [Fusarium albosuccineum]|uniref:Uncharacterized protein n=1 Tax=Fusarium albosuccineum TaxID=1237068 RepID=A0A8H4L680_9HYPO|nr:hypothetical protein FALBO_10336 [Fusarium albosuccineum]